MNTEDNLHLSKIERQVGTLKLAVLILGAALIYNSANKSGLLGEYKFVADKIEVKKIILKNSREVVGKIYYDELIGTVNESALGSDDGTLFVKDIQDPDYNHYRRRIRIVKRLVAQTQEFRRTFTNVLEGPSHEFDYVESVKTTSAVDPFMRSRNVFFNANGLRPLTKHFHYLDSQSPDIVPKLIEIEMISGSFSVFEDARIELVSLGDDPQIGYVRIQKPNHKFGDTSRPDVGAGLGSPSVLVEEYTVDPYDSSRPAPSNTYSATSKLLNIDVSSLATEEKYFGYAVKGAMVIGEKSGAVAKITSIDLVSDNWGDIIGSFFFRDANKTPRPP